MPAAQKQEYVSHFEPLVLEECAALLLRGNEEGVICLPHVAAIAGVDQVFASTLPEGGGRRGRRAIDWRCCDARSTLISRRKAVQAVTQGVVVHVGQ